MRRLGAAFVSTLVVACSSDYGTYSDTPGPAPDCSDEEQAFEAMPGSGPPPASVGEGGLDIATLASVPPACSGGKVVHFVYFVEADQVFDESTLRPIRAMFRVDDVAHELGHVLGLATGASRPTA